MSTWMIFRTIVRRHELTHCVDASPVVPWKAQHNFTLQFWFLCGNQSRAILGKIPAEHVRDVEQRAAPAHQATVVRTVTDHVTLSTQDRVLQGNCIETPASLRTAIHPGTIH